MQKQNEQTPNQETKPDMEQLMETIQALHEEIQTIKKEDNGNLPKLYLKMIAIMSDVTYIQKDKQNDFHKYKYASEEAIKKAVQKELIKNKVLFFVPDTKIIARAKSVNERGKETTLTTLEVKYEFIDAETGAKITGTYHGEGQDPLDKGVYKALTGALKYIITSHFLIPTGADPENDEDETKQDNSGKNKPATKAPANKATDPPSNKPWMKDTSVQETLKKIPNADLKQLAATEAWMNGHRISNVNKFALDQAVAIRKNELDGTLIPANLITDQKAK